MSNCVTDSDSDDNDALEALGKRYGNELDAEGLITYEISALSLDQQLAHKSQIEDEINVQKECERSQVVDATEQQLMKAQSDRVISAFENTFKITKSEMNNVPLLKPGRDTIIPRLSGSLFSAGPKVGIERLLDEKKYSEDFETIMRGQLTQNVEDLNVNSLICNCVKFPSEERHCLAKYLLFAMSVCKKERIVDTIYNVLLVFRDSWTLQLEDFLDIFINWGIPEQLIYPPYIFNDNKDSCSTNVAPDCNFEVAEYNVFKVLEYITEMFFGNVHLHPESTLTLVRIVLLMWLDKRFTNSWGSHKFGTFVKRMVDGIDTDVESPENLVCKTLDLSSEHAHNYAWLIVGLLEGMTPSSRLIGRLVATRFLLQAFDCEPATHRDGLDLRQLLALLVSESDVLSLNDLYIAHIVLLVVDAYLSSFPTERTDRETIEALVRWSEDMILEYSNDANCEMLDMHIVASQMKRINIRLRCCIKDYFGGRETIYWGRRQSALAQAGEEPTVSCAGVVSDRALDSGGDDRSTAIASDRDPEDRSGIAHVNLVSYELSDDEDDRSNRMDIASDRDSEDRSGIAVNLVSYEVSDDEDDRSTVCRMDINSHRDLEDGSGIVCLDVVPDQVSDVTGATYG